MSGAEARDWVQWLRAGFDALAVGGGTAKADDPSLTVRGAVQPVRPPIRVVLDRRAELPLDSALVKTARETPTLALVGRDTPAAARGGAAGRRASRWRPPTARPRRWPRWRDAASPACWSRVAASWRGAFSRRTSWTGCTW